MLGFINILSFFSRSEWIDILSGMMIPVVLLFISYIIQNKQIKEQTRITEEQFEKQIKITKEQFEEQIKITKYHFKEQNEISEKQIKEQNDLALKKEKRMLATQLRLSKYEEFYVSLQEYIYVNYLRYKNTSDYDTRSMTPEQFKEIDSELFIKRIQIGSRLKILIYFCPDLVDSWNYLYHSYTQLDNFISVNITERKQNDSESTNVELAVTELDNICQKEYSVYIDELKDIANAFQSKETDLNKLINNSIYNIMADLESDL